MTGGLKNVRHTFIKSLPAKPLVISTSVFYFSEDDMPPLPVVKQHGLYYFKHPTGFSSAVTVQGRRHYASDYKQHAGVDVPDDVTPIEPGESEFARQMGW